MDKSTRLKRQRDVCTQGQIATINLLHYPADHVMLGTEFSWGEREDISGNIGSDYRVQFSLKVDFDSGDLIPKN